MNAPHVIDSIGKHIFEIYHGINFDSVPYRSEISKDDINIIIDAHGFFHSCIFFLRVVSNRNDSIIRFSHAVRIDRIAGGISGLIVMIKNEDKRYLLWLPAVPVLARLDTHSRMTPSDGIHYRWKMGDSLDLEIEKKGQTQDVFIPLMIAATGVDDLFHELTSTEACERKLYVKSEWFTSNCPSDVFNYLINGSVYDPRSCPPVGKRFKCQQCAYAWWTYFDYICHRTRKKIWSVLRDEIALCALKDLDASGAWRNGFWSDDMEIHSRFQLDGLHLLISQFERTKTKVWLNAAKLGMEFVKEHLTDTLDDEGVWFLHDDVHASRRHKIRSKAFGKSEKNSLCLNTHIQALTVIHRLSLFCGDDEKDSYESLFRDGINSLKKVMAHQPADFLYGYLVPRMLSISRFTPRSTLDLIRNRLKKRLLKKLYWKVRACFPRLVHPNGFIERDLTIEIASDRYHVTNIKDLLVLYRQKPFPWLRTYIENGFEFLLNYLREVGIESALKRSTYYIEVAEILNMYDKFIHPITEKDRYDILDGIRRETGGSSLDYHASHLVHAPDEGKD